MTNPNTTPANPALAASLVALGFHEEGHPCSLRHSSGWHVYQNTEYDAKFGPAWVLSFWKPSWARRSMWVAQGQDAAPLLARLGEIAAQGWPSPLSRQKASHG